MNTNTFDTNATPNTFDLFASDNDVTESGDVLPSGFGPLDTGLYKMVIKLAYMQESKAGSWGLHLHMKSADNTGPEVRQSLYMTSNRANGQRNTYVDSKGMKHKLAGMELADNLATLVTDKEFNVTAKATAVDKVVKLWNPATSKEENTTVKVVESLMNQPILVGLIKTRDNKVVADSDGKFQPTSKERFSNEISKFFDPNTGLTYAEKRAKVTEPAYLQKWKETYKPTYVRDKYKLVDDEIAKDAAAVGISTTKALFP